MTTEPEVKENLTPNPSGEEPPVVAATPDSAPDPTTTGEGTPAGEEETPEQKKISKVQERIDELTRKRYDAERNAAYWKGIADAKSKETVVVEPEPVLLLTSKPRKEDFKDSEGFDDSDAYTEALVDWKAECKFQEREAKREVEKRKGEREIQQKRVSDWFVSAEAKYPDFPTADRAPTLAITPVMAEAMIDSEFGHEIGNFLGKNPQEAPRISKLTSVSQVREIGKLEVKFANPAETPKKIKTDAPTPIIPITSTVSTTEKKVEDMTMAEYVLFRNKQLFWDRK